MLNMTEAMSFDVPSAPLFGGHYGTKKDARLIELVRQNAILYDFSHPKYIDNCSKEKVWIEIGETLQLDGAACKARWNNIRDNYRKSLKKFTQTGGANRKYKYGDRLTFLNRYFHEKDLRPKLIFPEDEDCENGNDEEETFVYEYLDETEVEVENPLATLPHVIKEEAEEEAMPKGRKKRKTRNRLSSAEYNFNNDESATTNEVHPVDAFLAGIAPTLKNLTPYYLNLAKSEIFRAVQKYELDMIMQERKSHQSTSEEAS